MRSILLLFGVLAGVINTLMVGRYGFVTSDTAIDGAIAAFYFGIISLGAIGGPAVAVHFAARRRWMWGIVFGLIACVSLGANVVNSLGALAGRSDKTQAERVKARDDAKDDRAQLARIVAERATMAFTPASEASVEAAKAAVAAAERVRITECEDRGSRCRQRETEEATKRDTLATVLANKALTDKATKLDADAATIRARLDKAPAVQNVDPLGDAIGKLVHLPSEVAAAWQKASVVIVVELLIACALMAFELLGQAPRPAIAPKHAANVTPIEKARPLGEVAKFMVACLQPDEHAYVIVADLYQPYVAWCSREGLRALTASRFEEQVVALCEKAGFALSHIRGRVRCRGLQLAA
jgi:Poxvirus D5 protein-like